MRGERTEARPGGNSWEKAGRAGRRGHRGSANARASPPSARLRPGPLCAPPPPRGSCGPGRTPGRWQSWSAGLGGRGPRGRAGVPEPVCQGLPGGSLQVWPPRPRQAPGRSRPIPSRSSYVFPMPTAGPPPPAACGLAHLSVSTPDPGFLSRSASSSAEAAHTGGTLRGAPAPPGRCPRGHTGGRCSPCRSL